MLTKDQVEHLAKLSRLSLSQEEVDRFSLQLSSILDYVSQLQKVATSEVAPGHIAGKMNVMRSDQAKKLISYEVKKLIEAAPSHEGNFIKTKTVFDA